MILLLFRLSMNLFQTEIEIITSTCTIQSCWDALLYVSLYHGAATNLCMILWPIIYEDYYDA